MTDDTKSKPKTARSFSALSIQNAKIGRVHCGEPGLGLYLATSRSSQRFVFRYTKPGVGRVTEIAVGKYPQISLGEARHKARAMAREVALGVDPSEAKRQRQAQDRRQATDFAAAMTLYHRQFAGRPGVEALRLRVARHAAGMMATPIEKVDTQTIARALAAVQRSSP
jgi:hypothetical protein